MEMPDCGWVGLTVQPAEWRARERASPLLWNSQMTVGRLWEWAFPDTVTASRQRTWCLGRLFQERLLLRTCLQLCFRCMQANAEIRNRTLNCGATAGLLHSAASPLFRRPDVQINWHLLTGLQHWKRTTVCVSQRWHYNENLREV